MDLVGRLLPVALDLDGDGLELVSIGSSTALFDGDSDGFLENMGWLSGDDGFLFTDLDGDGSVSSPEELVIAAQTADEADTDLEALATLYDDNGDGFLDANDSSWSMMKVWQDLNQNGKSESGEVASLADHGIDGINLARTVVPEDGQDIEGNTLSATSSFSRTDGSTGTVGDVALRTSSAGVKYDSNTGGAELHLEGARQSTFFANNGDPLNLDATLAEYDAVYGSNENDVVRTSGWGAVVLSGGNGDDALSGGGGHDWVAGGGGADTLHGGKGHDVLIIDASDTHISGGAGFDVAWVSGSAGTTLDLASSGIEAAVGHDGDDVFSAAGYTASLDADGNLSAEEILLDGGLGDDVLTGGDGNDLLSGGEGTDTLIGGAGDDRLIIDAFDTFNGGEGIDTAIYTGDSDLDLTIQDQGIEVFFAGSGNDTLSSVETLAVVIHGGAGDDTLNGGLGNDRLIGGTGSDTLRGGYGDDTYVFERGDGATVIHDFFLPELTDSEAAAFRIAYGTPAGATPEYDAGSADVVNFGYGITLNDVHFTHDQNHVTLSIADGAGTSVNNLTDKIELRNQYIDSYTPDGLIFARRIEKLQFANGTEVDFNAVLSDSTVYATTSSWTNIGELVRAELSPVGSMDQAEFQSASILKGSNQDDVLIGDSSIDVAYGDSGADTISTGGGNDVVDAGSGNDVIYGDSGDDELYGGAGDDTLVGGSGDDRIFGGYGSDVAVYSGSILDYTLSRQAGNKVAVHNTVREERDTVVDVAELRFVDHSVFLDGRNNAPTSQRLHRVAVEDAGAVTITAAEIEGLVEDRDGDAVSLTGVGTATFGGEVVLTDDGDIVFTPSTNYSGIGLFEYTLSDGSDDGTFTSLGTITIAAVADTPSLTVAESEGYSTVPIDLDIDAVLSDSDGSESLAIEIEGSLTAQNSPMG